MEGKINLILKRERTFFFLSNKEDFLYKAPLTANVFKDFSSCYQHLSGDSTLSSSGSDPFVYADESGVKLITRVIESNPKGEDDIFALSIADDGWMEMLVMCEAR